MNGHDFFTRDEDGFLYWVAKRGDMFKRSGFEVNPHEIETRLRQHHDVAEASVVPVPDHQAGEVPAACVVPRRGATLDAAQLCRFCAEVLDWNMVPAVVLIYDELPRLETGKTDRRELRRAASAHQAEQGAGQW